MVDDSYRHKGLRQKLVDIVKEKGIKDSRILDAIGKVPRHCFMDSGFIEFAYRDQAFPIAAGQTISQPYTVAFQTELLEVKKHDKVLEVGTGSGYQCAILLELGAKVHTVERQRELFLKSKVILGEMGYKPYFYYGDGYLGLPSQTPFDKIIITAGAPEIPRELLKQLKLGGRMVVPVGGSSGQVMMTIDRINEDDYKETERGYFAFVPMLKGKQ